MSDPMRGWSRAEEVQPEVNVYVICYDAVRGRRFVGSWHPKGLTGFNKTGFWCDEESTYVTVTHWRPFPELPEGVL